MYDIGYTVSVILTTIHEFFKLDRQQNNEGDENLRFEVGI